MRFRRMDKPKDRETKVVEHFAFIPTLCEVVDPKTGKKINKLEIVWLEKYFTFHVYFAEDNYWLGGYKPLVYGD